MKILIVEDNEYSRNLLMEQLRASDRDVMAAVNGAEALGQALVQPPDIIVSDIMMPKMDGFQLCHECKQNDKLKDIPFIFYSATYIAEEDERFALSLGADAFVAKPIERDILIQKVNEVFEQAKSAALAAHKTALLEPSLFLSEYSKRIVAKLEDKLAELETEIAQRRRAEEEIRQTAEQWMTTFDSITDLVSIQDKDFRIVRVNKACADTLQKSREELVGKRCYEVFHGTDTTVPNCPHLKTLQTKGPHIEEFYEPRLTAHLEVATSPIFNGGGEVVASVHVARDITKRKKAEHDIGERVKELTCLYGVSQVAARTDSNLDETLKATVNLIPDGWQYPEIACVRVTLHGKESRTDNFAVTEWRQSSDIEVGSEKLGALEVYYLEERPEMDEGPFLKEERNLINALASTLGEIAKRNRADWALEQKMRETTALNNLFVTYLNQGFEAAETYGSHASKIMKAAEELQYLFVQGSGSVETCGRLARDITKMAEDIQALAREAEARKVEAQSQPADTGKEER